MRSCPGSKTPFHGNPFHLLRRIPLPPSLHLLHCLASAGASTEGRWRQYHGRSFLLAYGRMPVYHLLSGLAHGRPREAGLLPLSRLPLLDPVQDFGLNVAADAAAAAAAAVRPRLGQVEGQRQPAAWMT